LIWTSGRALLCCFFSLSSFFERAFWEGKLRCYLLEREKIHLLIEYYASSSTVPAFSDVPLIRIVMASISPPPGSGDSRSLSPAAFRNFNDQEEGERTPLLQAQDGISPSPSPFLEQLPESSGPAPSWTEKLLENATDFWLQGKGMILVMMSQFFGASMNVMTQVLELKGRDGKGFKPFQVRLSESARSSS
jgi:hypothetical protein